MTTRTPTTHVPKETTQLGTQPLMRCGHRANAVNHYGLPVCVICIGIDPGAEQIGEEPNLTGRICRCASCGRQVPSSRAHAFFQSRPDKAFDLDYCGCAGWD